MRQRRFGSFSSMGEKMSEEKANEILEKYFKSMIYLNCVEYLVENSIPFEEWPEEFKGDKK